MSNDYDGEERRHGERITKLEVKIEGVDLLREELVQFRHDLFGLLNPLKDTVSENNSDIKSLRGLYPRVSKLEHWRTLLVGMWTAGGLVVYAIWELFKNKIHERLGG